MMFQSYALWPHMTVAKNVAFGLEERRTPSPEIEQRVKQALSSVRMEDYAERKIAQLPVASNSGSPSLALSIRPRAPAAGRASVES
jgi:iron(III) transport system ATP-binding protein